LADQQIESLAAVVPAIQGLKFKKNQGFTSLTP
jgi:hypothetical protein